MRVRVPRIAARRAAILAAAAVAIAPSTTLAQALGGGFGRATPAATPVVGPTATATRTATPERTPGPTARPETEASTARPPRPAALSVPPSARPAAESGRASASAGVSYVLVPLVVTDRKGRPVKDLEQGDVTLYADGKPVALDLFEKSDAAPVSFAILLDTSGSMALAGKMDGARVALLELLSRRRPGDDFALFTFSSGEVRETVPFTQDVSRLRRALAEAKPWGRTAFYDALAKMPDESLKGKNGTRAIVLLTDGIDNASRLTTDDVVVLLEGVDVPVFPIGLRSPGAFRAPPPGFTAEALLNLDVLGHLARASGGRVAIVDDPAALSGVVSELEGDLRTQYLLGFSPTGSGGIKYRKFALKLSGPARPVRMRAGYRGTEAPVREGSRSGR